MAMYLTRRNGSLKSIWIAIYLLHLEDPRKFMIVSS